MPRRFHVVPGGRVKRVRHRFGGDLKPFADVFDLASRLRKDKLIEQHARQDVLDGLSSDHRLIAVLDLDDHLVDIDLIIDRYEETVSIIPVERPAVEVMPLIPKKRGGAMPALRQPLQLLFRELRHQASLSLY